MLSVVYVYRNVIFGLMDWYDELSIYQIQFALAFKDLKSLLLTTRFSDTVKPGSFSCIWVKFGIIL